MKALGARRKHLEAVVNQQGEHGATSLDSNVKSASPELTQSTSAGTAALRENHQSNPITQTFKAQSLDLFCGQTLSINIFRAAHGGRKEKEQAEGPAFGYQAHIGLILRRKQVYIQKRLMVAHNNRPRILHCHMCVANTHRQLGPQKKQRRAAIKPDVPPINHAHDTGENRVQRGNAQS